MSTGTSAIADQPDKTRLRADARARRAALDPVDRAAWSGRVAAQVAALVPPAGPVMSYLAMGDELDTGPLNRRLAAEQRLVVPRVEGRRLVAVPWDGTGELVVSRFGVAEPVGAEIDPGRLVAVVVPALAYDRAGHRIGYGAGFYDRFLPTLSSGCLLVGVAFSAQLVDDIGPEAHDVAIPTVITEDGVVGRPRSTAESR